MAAQNKPGQSGENTGGARGASNQGGDALDGIPMQKTNPMIFVGVGVAVVALIGVLIWSSSGDKEASRKAEEIEAAAATEPAVAGMTPKEQAEHMKRTQQALENLKASQAQKQAAAEEAKAKAEEATAAAPAAQQGGGDYAAAAAAAPAAKPAKPASKKDLDSLDSIGSDITSGLK